MFALTPQHRLRYLSETERKQKDNEERLQKIMKKPTDNEKFLVSLIETAIIIANKNNGQNELILKELKDLYFGDKDHLLRVLDYLKIELCTSCHYYDAHCEE